MSAKWEKPELTKFENLRELTKMDPLWQTSVLNPPGGGGGYAGGVGFIPTSGVSGQILPVTGLAVGVYAAIGAAFIGAGTIIRKIRKI